jgi:hypothetical protein
MSKKLITVSQELTATRCTNFNVWSVILWRKKSDGHQYTSKIMNSDLLVPIHPKSHQLPFRNAGPFMSSTISMTPPQSCLPLTWPSTLGVCEHEHPLNLSLIYPPSPYQHLSLSITNSMAYGTRSFYAAFTSVLQ